MKGIVRRCYGSPEVVRYEDLAKPTPLDNEILVKVHAASVNPLDWHYLEGKPYLVRIDGGFGKPQNPRLGVDFAGTVEAVGSKVTRFKAGDEVFGGRFGSFADYVAVREDRAVALKPANMTFEQAAAVQIAKSFGADVTGVCSTRNVALVRSIGADHVIDYTHEDFTAGTERYDLIVDNVGTHSVSDYRRVLNPNGIYVMIGSTAPGNWFGWLAGPIEGMVMSKFVSQKFAMMLADLNKDDLATLAALMQSGKLTPVIDRRYKLSEASEALRYLEAGHAKGKVVLTVE